MKNASAITSLLQQKARNTVTFHSVFHPGCRNWRSLSIGVWVRDFTTTFDILCGIIVLFCCLSKKIWSAEIDSCFRSFSSNWCAFAAKSINYVILHWLSRKQQQRQSIIITVIIIASTWYTVAPLLSSRPHHCALNIAHVCYSHTEISCCEDRKKSLLLRPLCFACVLYCLTIREILAQPAHRRPDRSASEVWS